MFKKFYTPVLINLTLFFLADRPGDHIIICGRNTKRWFRSAAYYHHGIYIGESNGKEVADFGREQHEYPVYCTLKKFMEGPDGEPKTQLYRRNYKNGAFLEEETINLVDKICQNRGFLCYKLIGKNCEHFASIVRTGYRTSSQAQKSYFWLLFPSYCKLLGDPIDCVIVLLLYRIYFNPTTDLPNSKIPLIINFLVFKRLITMSRIK